MWFLTIVRLIRIQVRAWLPNLVPNIVFLFCNLVPKNDTSSPQIYIYCSKFAIWLKRHVNRKNIGLCNFNFSVTKYIKHLRIYQNKIKDCDLSRILKRHLKKKIMKSGKVLKLILFVALLTSSCVASSNSDILENDEKPSVKR